MLRKAKKKLRSILISGKAENLPFRNNVFDYVTVWFWIKKFSDLNKSIIEIRRVLKKE